MNNNFNNIINTINNSECTTFMKNYIPNESIDLTITSPPYDDLRDYKGYTFDFENTAKELFRITKQGGVVVWVVGDTVKNGSESGNSFRQALFFKEIGFNIHDTMIYEKNGMSFPDKIRYYQIFEYMFILSKGRPKTFNPIEDRKNKTTGSWGFVSNRKKDGILIQSMKKEILNNEEIKKPIKIITKKETGRRFNIWKYNTGAGFTTKDKYAFAHPAMFPEKLALDHIRSWSNENDIVFDPMVGSGTTAKMCILANRKFIGCEISKEYCGIAERRVEKYSNIGNIQI